MFVICECALRNISISSLLIASALMVRNMSELKIQITPIAQLVDLDDTMVKRSPLAATAPAIVNVEARLQQNYLT